MKKHFMITCGLLALFSSTILEAKDPPKILTLMTKGFNRGEFWQPYTTFILSGFKIDVAGVDKNKILRDKAGEKEGPWDFQPDLTLDEVNVEDYDALFIPGGYSPSFLEKYPRAVEICKEFHAKNKPIGAICHGPRLLMKADLLKDRVATCWFEVSSELPDAWKRRDQGKYVKEATVRDGNFLTARYPNDNIPFIRAFYEMLGEELEPEIKQRSVDLNKQPFSGFKKIYDEKKRAFIAHFKSLGWELEEKDGKSSLKWVGMKSPEVSPLPVATIVLEKGFDDVSYVLAKTHLLGRGFSVQVQSSEKNWVIGKNGIPVKVDKSTKKSEKSFAILEPQKHRETLDWIAKIAPQISQPFDAERDIDVVLTLREGYEAPSAIALKAWFLSKNKNVVVMAHEKGERVSLNGFKLHADVTYDDQLKFSDSPIIVAPGSVWPEKAEHIQDLSEGSEYAEWIKNQAKLDDKRMAWILGKLDQGRQVIAVGFDSYHLGRKERFKGLEFAAPDQNIWLLGKKKEVGIYAKGKVASRTNDHLITIKGLQGIHEGVKLLDKPSF